MIRPFAPISQGREPCEFKSDFLPNSNLGFAEKRFRFPMLALRKWFIIQMNHQSERFKKRFINRVSAVADVDRLIGVLRRRGLQSGSEIQHNLGISRATLSRLVKQAGPQVARFGRSVATRYALSREIAGLGRSTPVFRVDEQGVVGDHGMLHWVAGDGCWL